MPSSVTDLLALPSFKLLSKKAQEDMIAEVTMGAKRTPEIKSPTALDMQDEMKTYGEGGPKDVKNTVLSGLLGLATGGPMGGAMGAAMPATTPGGYATMAAGPLLGQAGRLLSKIKTPVLRGGASALAGLLGGQGLSALSEGVNRVAQPERPKGDIFDTNPLSLALSAMPGLADYFTHGTVQKAPSTKGANLMSQLTGEVQPASAARTAQGITPGTTLQSADQAMQAGNPNPAISTLGSFATQSQTRQAAREAKRAEEILQETQRLAQAKEATQQQTLGLTQQQAQNSTAQGQVQTGLAGINTDQAQMRAKYAKVDLPPNPFKMATSKLEQAREQERLAYIQAQADKISQEKQLARANSPLSEKPEINARANVDIKAEGDYQAGLKQQIDNLQTQATNYEAMNPGVRRLVWDPTPNSGRLRPTVNEIIQRVAAPETTPEEITGLRNHLSNQGAAHVDTFQKAMTEEFMRQAYDPNTHNLTNAPALMKAGGPFSQQKIAAIYGISTGSPKIAEFTRAVDDISSLTQAGGLAGNFAKQAVSHAAWLSAGMIFFPGTAWSQRGMTVAGAGLVGIAYPKLVDMLLHDPKAGKMFHDWATSPNRSMKSLTNWPSLAARLKDISEPVDTADKDKIDAEVKELQKMQGQTSQP